MKSGPVSEIAAIKHLGGDRQEPGDERPAGGDGAVLPGMSGALWGLSGEERRALGLGWLAGMAIVTTIITINILTRRHDHPDESPLAPLIYEGSSALLLTVALLIPASVALWLTRGARPGWAMGLVHLVALAAFSALHVGGFVIVRKIAFAGWGETYRFGSLTGEYPYELGKDMVAYVMSTAGNWLILRFREVLVVPRSELAAPSSFDIRDGARLVRAPLDDILAVRSAGNYAEFLLSDGRRPLMRISLAGVEARLAPAGFVRTHRSWLVNAAKVTGLRPEGSGDYAVELGAVEAPLSRRFPAALTALRSWASSQSSLF